MEWHLPKLRILLPFLRTDTAKDMLASPENSVSVIAYALCYRKPLSRALKNEFPRREADLGYS